MIHDILPVNSYVGNNVATNFDFDFFVENSSQLNVFLYNSDGAKTKLIYNVDYSINEFKNPNGGYITFPITGSSYSILSEDEKISLELTLPISQETVYNNGTLLNFKSIEYSFDYVTRLIQILSRRLNSCIEVNDYTSKDITELIQKVLDCASLAQSAYEGIQEYGFSVATETTTGVVKIGSGINVDSEGEISITEGSDKSLQNLTALGNSKLQFAPFAINNGVVSSSQNATLSYSSETITCSPCIITTADGRTKVFDDAVSLDVSDTADGDYKILKDYNDGSLSLVSNLVFSKTNPEWFDYNITEVGTLTKNDGVISGFSSSNYAQLPSIFNPSSNTWEIVFAFTTGTTSSDYVINQGYFANPNYYGIALRVYSGNIDIMLGFGSTNNTVTICPASNNTYYKVKIEFTGSSYNTYYYSGGAWVAGGTLSSSTSIAYSSTYSMNYIGLYNTQYNIFGGSIDLEESYINVGGEYFWQGGNYIYPNWVDTSTIPANLKVYNNDSYAINNDLVYIGDCTISSGGVDSLTNREFNNSGYLIQKYGGSQGLDSFIPNYSAGVSKVWGTSYTADSAGWVYVRGGAGNSVDSHLEVNGVTVILCMAGNSTAYTGSGAFVAKGDSYKASGGNSAGTIIFYPLKGVTQ